MALIKKQQLDELLQAAIDSYHAGRLDEAVHHLTRNANAFPKALRLWGYLGFLYGEAGEDAKAAHAFRKAVTLSPHSEKASLGLFHSLWRTDKINAAFDEMRRFVKAHDSPNYRRLIRDMLAEDPNEPTASAGELVNASYGRLMNQEVDLIEQARNAGQKYIESFNDGIDALTADLNRRALMEGRKTVALAPKPPHPWQLSQASAAVPSEKKAS